MMGRIRVRNRTQPGRNGPASDRLRRRTVQREGEKTLIRLNSATLPQPLPATVICRAAYHFEELSELFKLICSTHQSIECRVRISRLKILGFFVDFVRLGSPFGLILVSKCRVCQDLHFDISYDPFALQKRENRS